MFLFSFMKIACAYVDEKIDVGEEVLCNDLRRFLDNGIHE
jgi:hypothetical protein